MSKRKKNQKVNVEMILKSAITAAQTDFNSYKKILTKYLNSSFISDDGTLCYLGDPAELKKKVDDAYEKYESSFKYALAVKYTIENWPRHENFENDIKELVNNETTMQGVQE